MSDPGARPPAADKARRDETSTIKAAALIGAAVLIGIILLAKGFSQEGGLVDTAAPTRADAPTTTTTAGPEHEETTTTTAAAKSPSEVSVMIANGSGKAGVAGQAQTKLKDKGYTKVDTTNASTVSKTAVYHTPESEADARAVAEALGLSESVVAPMPSPPPANAGGATVLVVIGSDGA